MSDEDARESYPPFQWAKEIWEEPRLKPASSPNDALVDGDTRLIRDVVRYADDCVTSNPEYTEHLPFMITEVDADGDIKVPYPDIDGKHKEESAAQIFKARGMPFDARVPPHSPAIIFWLNTDWINPNTKMEIGKFEPIAIGPDINKSLKPFIHALSSKTDFSALQMCSAIIPAFTKSGDHQQYCAAVILCAPEQDREKLIGDGPDSVLNILRDEREKAKGELVKDTISDGTSTFNPPQGYQERLLLDRSLTERRRGIE